MQVDPGRLPRPCSGQITAANSTSNSHMPGSSVWQKPLPMAITNTSKAGLWPAAANGRATAGISTIALAVRDVTSRCDSKASTGARARPATGGRRSM